MVGQRAEVREHPVTELARVVSARLRMTQDDLLEVDVAQVRDESKVGVDLSGAFWAVVPQLVLPPRLVDQNFSIVSFRFGAIQDFVQEVVSRGQVVGQRPEGSKLAFAESAGRLLDCVGHQQVAHLVEVHVANVAHHGVVVGRRLGAVRASHLVCVDISSEMPLKLRLPSGLAAAAHQADLLVFESHLHFRESLGQVRMATEHVGQKSAAGLESLFAPGAVHLGVAELVGQVLGEMGNGQMPLDLDGNVGNVQLAHRALHLWSSRHCFGLRHWSLPCLDSRWLPKAFSYSGSLLKVQSQQALASFPPGFQAGTLTIF